MTIKIGVIGAGYFGTRHAQNYAHMKNVILSAIADTNEDAARKLARPNKRQTLLPTQSAPQPSGRRQHHDAKPQPTPKSPYPISAPESQPS